MVVGLLPRVLLLPSIKPNCPLIIIMIAVPQCSLAKGMFLSQQNIFISAKYFCLDKMFFQDNFFLLRQKYALGKRTLRHGNHDGYHHHHHHHHDNNDDDDDDDERAVGFYRRQKQNSRQQTHHHFSSS